MTRFRRYGIVSWCLCLSLTLVLSNEANARKPNVLFIAVDDLRPELGCYGKSQIKSPNIDRLASQGIVFERAYCMVPTCGASRASLMTGIRPSRSRFVNYSTWAEKDAPGITTLNTHFKRHGYYTVSLGKVFHHPNDNAEGWSEPAWRPRGVPWYRRPENQELHVRRQKQGDRKRGPAWESADVPDRAYADGILAERAVKDLRRLKEKDEPFFLAVGFFKPHLPFIAPKKYWDLYEYEKIRLPDNYYVPSDSPKESIHTSGELRAYAGIPAAGAVPNDAARKLIHGYYACVSYTDALIGKLLDELDRLELANDTIVVLWGDHGWNLGEHTLWCKHSCYETSMHAPLIIKAPGIDGGEKTRGLTEFIDIYPSLSELAGLPLPEHLQGRSFVPLLRSPEHEWKTEAIGRFRNGDTIRTDRFRYTEYTDGKRKFLARMLYDHESDPNENVNVSERDDQPNAVQSLTKQLRQGMGKDHQ